MPGAVRLGPNGLGSADATAGALVMVVVAGVLLTAIPPSVTRNEGIGGSFLRRLIRRWQP